MNILGISCFYHDAAAALLRDGQVVAVAEEERFTRKKHDFGFPANAIGFCLKRGGIGPNELDYVVFYERPFLKFERVLLTTLQSFPRSWRVWKDAMTTWLQDKLWIKSLIRDKVEVPAEKLLFVDHHMSHAASAFFCSPFEEAAIVTADGVGEWTTTALGWAKGRDIRLTKEIRFPHSIGLLYSTFTAFLGFEVNEGEYKVMGMAPYGQPRYVDKIYKLVRLQEDGSFQLDMDYFAYHNSTERMFNSRFEELFGTPRKPSERDRLDPYYADLAASIQAVTEDILLRLARQAYKETKVKQLCMAGGVALNSVANGRILKETPFEQIYIQPAAGDSGGALGAALYVYHAILGNPRSFVMEHAYWGEEYSAGDIKAFLDDNNIAYEYLENEDLLLDQVTQELLDGKVVGWFQGRFEFGPRALGNRSILADPRRAEMKDIVNMKVKFREPFRPFAPSVLMEHAEDFFDLPTPETHYPARFMLYVVKVKEGKAAAVPATTHVDGTARLQTVSFDSNPLYYRLIDRFRAATGVPMVLNTSFNRRGEPIICRPVEAYECYTKTEIDCLVMDRFLLRKGR